MTAWLDYARADIGECIVLGAGSNPLILQRWQEAGLTPDASMGDDTPGCSALLQAWLAKAGVAGTGSPAAASFESWGEACELRRGAVALIKTPGSSRISHVCLVLEDQNDKVLVLGANQGAEHAVTVTRYNKRSICGYRWPAGQPVPGPTTLAELTASGSETNAHALTLKSASGWVTSVTATLTAAQQAPHLLAALAPTGLASRAPDAAAGAPASAAASVSAVSAAPMTPPSVIDPSAWAGSIQSAKQLGTAILELSSFIGQHAMLGLLLAGMAGYLIAEKIRLARAKTADTLKAKAI